MKIVIAGAGEVGYTFSENVISRESGHHFDGSE